ncbi:MAG: peptidyl-prolyl cis-trans isomerase [Bacteroidaceae bacterium]|nr:peptidylprolyl isomerase [Candidatus Colenecus caballi]MCQ2071972.1 peptidyl-prolyl cis-trans isomerase [Bacteroidaceae bacterium]
MRKLLFTVLSVILFLPSSAKTGDGPVMTAGGYEVSKPEFEHFLWNNFRSESFTKKELKEYANLYLDFKLKVLAATDAGMDKEESFINDLKEFRDSHSEEFMVDSDFLEEAAYTIYNNSFEAVGPDGLCYMGIMTIAPQDESAQASVKAYMKADSIYHCLKNGEDFGMLAMRFSFDATASKGGAAGWMARSQLPEIIADSLFSLEEGAFCRPFELDNLFVIVYNMGHRDLGSFVQSRDEILDFIREQPDIYGEAFKRRAEAYSRQYGWGVTGDTAVMYMDSLIDEIAPEYADLVRDYHDGLLMYDISTQMVWDKVMTDSTGLAAYYEANRESLWKDGDRFKGMVLFCKDETLFREVEAALEDIPFEEWSRVIIRFNTGNSRIRAMRGTSGNGVFKKGQNEYVDALVFGEGTFEPMSGYPYANVVGKRVSCPESMADALTEVSEGYQESLERAWVKDLRKKYKYKIYRKALYRVMRQD